MKMEYRDSLNSDWGGNTKIKDFEKGYNFIILK